MFRLAGGSQPGVRLLPDVTPPHTAMSFEVADIRAEIDALKSQGVAFEDYDQPGFTTVDHVLDDGGGRRRGSRPGRQRPCLHQPG